MAKLTPVMRQYADAKALHPDAILFFRLGDFYEMFFDDAVVASSVLGITLTSRNKESPTSEPMAGVPHHSAHGYIARLLAAGHKVAICEQLADPSKVKGIVPRAVVRVVTPGLVTDDDQLEARENHFLCALEHLEGHGYGVALLDLSTGELSAATLPDAAQAVGEVSRASAREVLLGLGAADLEPTLREIVPRAVLRAPSAAPAVEATLDAVLGVEGGADARRTHGPAALAAAARVLAFAADCSPRAPLPVRRVGLLDVAHAMRVDETTQAHLELVRAADGGRAGTLLDTIDRTITAAGARALRRRVLAPLTDVGAIRARLDQVELLVIHARVRCELRSCLQGMPDLERLAVRVALGQATPRDLGLLRDGLAKIPGLRAAIESLPASERALAGLELSDDPSQDPLVSDLAGLLGAALVERPPTLEREGSYIKDGFDEELDAARRTSRDGAALIVALEAKLREDTGAQGLRVRYNSVFGWYIEVTRSHLSKVPPTFRRKQTVATGERFSTDALDQLAADIESADERARERESGIWSRLVEQARRAEPRVRELSRRIAEIDVAAALAEVAHQNDYARPEVDGSEVIEIVDGRHPVVEQHAAKGRFVPNDTSLDTDGKRLYLVTGPNMAGKSTLMRQVALIALLAQAGSYVPARRARIGVVDRLLSRVGASDNLARGESTFMVEMRETAGILRAATRKSLVILDEIGRGTSTYDGLSIAWAVAEHLHDDVKCRALFATHYHELTELSKTAPHVCNVSVSAREHDGAVVFLHRLTDGPASRSYGVAVAKLAGVPDKVLGRARALLEAFEAGGRPAAGGEPAPGEARRLPGDDQLGLFGPPAEPPLKKGERGVLAALRDADVDRMTPLDALTLVAKLKRRLS